MLSMQSATKVWLVEGRAQPLNMAARKTEANIWIGFINMTLLDMDKNGIQNIVMIPLDWKIGKRFTIIEKYKWLEIFII